MPMSTFENIDGNKLLSIFQLLITQKIFIKVHLPQVDYESLTLVTDTRNEDRQPTFMIDVPKGLHKALAETKSNRLSFEFTSSDKVTHRFISDIETISKSAISLLYPAFIQRHQQRDNFRVKAPYDSHAIVTIDDNKIRMEIDNVSLGGVFCYCQNKYKSLITQGLELTGMELYFTLKNQCVNVSIQRTIIKRIESRHRPKHFGVAFEFIQIKKDAKKILVQQIYELQRAFLQNRLKIMQ
jgi:c-di-GMP-binding flagellar brake protein YcgR